MRNVSLAAPCSAITVAVLLAACGGRATYLDTSSGAGGAGHATSGAQAIDTISCTSPEPLLQSGTAVPSGFLRCGDGFIHRVEPATCVAPVTPGSCGADDGGECGTDADCVELPYGACVKEQPWGCSCHYGCASDADCADGRICACAGVVGGRARCIPADCATTAACAGSLCGLSERRGSCGERWGRLACLTPDAECRIDADCSGAEPVSCFSQGPTPPECKNDGERWICTEPDACGPCG